LPFVSFLFFNYLFEHPLKVNSSFFDFFYIPYAFQIFDLKKYFRSPIECVITFFKVNSTLLLVLYNVTDFTLEFVTKHKRKSYYNCLLVWKCFNVVSIILQFLPNSNFMIILAISLWYFSPIQCHFITSSILFSIFIFSKFVLLKRTVNVSFTILFIILVFSFKNIFIFFFNNNCQVIFLIKNFFFLTNIHQ